MKRRPRWPAEGLAAGHHGHHCRCLRALISPLVMVISSIAATKVFEEVFLMTQGGPGRLDSNPGLLRLRPGLQGELEISYASPFGSGAVLDRDGVQPGALFLAAGDLGLT